MRLKMENKTEQASLNIFFCGARERERSELKVFEQSAYKLYKHITLVIVPLSSSLLSLQESFNHPSVSHSQQSQEMSELVKSKEKKLNSRLSSKKEKQVLLCIWRRLFLELHY